MGKRGPKPKSVDPLEKILATGQQETTVKQHKKPIVPNTSQDTGFSTESMYDKYDEFKAQEIANEQGLTEQETEPDKTVQQEVTPEQEVTEKRELETVIPAAQDKQPEPEPVKVEQFVKETAPQKEEKIEKTVPLAALHETRFKLDTVKNELKEVKRRLAEFESHRKEETLSEQTEDFEYATKKEIKALQDKLDNYEREKQEQKNNEDIARVDTLLTKEGIPGFKDFILPLVHKELNRMFAEDPAYAIAHDNPEGWMKISREVYPQIKALFIDADKKRVMDEKEQRKQSAGMVNSPGIKQVVETKETQKPLTREEENAAYVRLLRANSI